MSGDPDVFAGPDQRGGPGLRGDTDPRDDSDLRAVAPVIAEVRRRPPLVHCVTATVSMGIVADGLLAAGARPMMTETEAEAPVVTGAADALLVNLGTLSTDAMTGIPATVAASIAAGHPWVLDPTAIGRAPVRTALARELVELRPDVVRGNASEVLALRGGPGGRGADAADATESARGAAARIATLTGGAVAVSGPVDWIVGAGAGAGAGAGVGPGTDDEPNTAGIEVRRGHPLLTRVTGTGCLLGALTAACLVATRRIGTDGPAVLAARAATVWLDVAGERAARNAPRPGAFRSALLDALDEIGEHALQSTEEES
ncbi:hydroxyethylthiazole kinase [Brachybacterium halotolerans subsp. kimchii]|uniref:hydroxyethylthiazole kinase n=1 Tax=Brachybacterium halotolerans TaxID=2795215 RepID=UPI001E5358B1|nr:hydroxyethylthiazole kinase [Brachybacterium halotolerans]UEJ82829.1 hydroxyethylthiazole kinase [Brachybacterium halotolerans subsp. kimchii]